MVIVDPIVAALDMRYNSHKDLNVRAVLSRLHQAAEEEGCAITLVGHLNKGSSTDAYTRVGSSVAFWNASRAVVLVTEDDDDPDVYRIVTQAKTNLGPPQPWRIQDVRLGEDENGRH